MSKEFWRNIEGYKELYQISNTGKVRSFKNKNIIILKQRKNSRGYWYVNLCIDGKYKSITVHRLVALHFFDKSDRNETVNHIDGNKDNNCIFNLEWITRKENWEHAKRNNLLAMGEKNGKSKLKEKDVLEIRNLYKKSKKSKKSTHRSLAKRYNVSKTCIGLILQRKRWSFL